MNLSRKTIVAGIFVAAFFSVFSTNSSFACSRMVRFSFDEIFVADAIVIATAEKYVGEPDLTIINFGVPDTQVVFKVDEVLKGDKVPATIVLNAYLSTVDDFNDQDVPYKFVRPNGRGGTCFANTYKKGASFLLFLKKTEHGYTSNISALGPSNEQLHDAQDPWLLWTREEIRKRSGK
jgi:hypothetical protein